MNKRDTIQSFRVVGVYHLRGEHGGNVQATIEASSFQEAERIFRENLKKKYGQETSVQTFPEGCREIPGTDEKFIEDTMELQAS